MNTITTNDIKKALFVQKPITIFSYADKEGLHYTTAKPVLFGTELLMVLFKIPYAEVEAKFDSTMPSTLMTKWAYLEQQ